MKVITFRCDALFTYIVDFETDFMQVTLKERDSSSQKADLDIIFRLFPVIEVWLFIRMLANYVGDFICIIRKILQLNLNLMQG